MEQARNTISCSMSKNVEARNNSASDEAKIVWINLGKGLLKGSIKLPSRLPLLTRDMSVDQLVYREAITRCVFTIAHLCALMTRPRWGSRSVRFCGRGSASGVCAGRGSRSEGEVV